MPDPIAFQSGEFIPASAVSVAPQDMGFMLGVTVAEQLRTFGGELFSPRTHLDRLEGSLEVIGIREQIDVERLANAAREVVAHNYALLDVGDDLGVTMFVTPGLYPNYRAAGEPATPMVVVHTHPLAFSLWADKYTTGQRCVISSVPQVNSCCWPRFLKCRSRAHYFLADQEARRVDPDARAILLDEQGDVNEASTANLVAYFQDEGLVSPPLDNILPGVSLSFVEQLAAELKCNFVYRRLTVEQLRRADGLLLTSTSPCVLPVSALDGQPFSSGSTTIAGRLLTAWSEKVDVDIVAQAERFAARP